MLDGFQYVLAQVALVVAVTALLAGVLGWLIGRGNGRRRAEKAMALSTSPAPTPDLPPVTPAPAAPTHLIESDAPHFVAVSEGSPTPVLPDTEPLIEHAPMHAMEDPDRTVIRMPPSLASGGPGTTPYLPPTAVATYSAPVANPAPVLPTSSLRVVTVEEVQFLRQELRQRDLELGRIEAGALSAWDRMVPQLDEQIENLVAENHTLKRRLREAEEHSDADALNVDHLRTLVADRDAKIAELGAQG